MTKEMVNHPEHYGGDTTYEAIKVIEAWGLDFCLGNTVKYICRAGKKTNELEDLNKAKWYLDRRIAQITRGNVNEVEESQSVSNEEETRVRFTSDIRPMRAAFAIFTETELDWIRYRDGANVSRYHYYHRGPGNQALCQAGPIEGKYRSYLCASDMTRNLEWVKKSVCSACLESLGDEHHKVMKGE